MEYGIFTTGWKSLNNLQLCVEEAYASTQVPSEFCVVVNPYGEDTQKIIEYCATEKRITRYAVMSQNIGCGRAFNTGFNLCESPFVVALSDDCRVGPSTYEKMIKEFNNVEVGIVGVEMGGRPEHKRPTIKGFLLAYRLEMINEIGGYNILNGPLADEHGLGLKAWAYGWSSVVAPDCEWQHVHDISNFPDQDLPFMGRTFNVAKTPDVHNSCLAQWDQYNSLIDG